MKPTNSANHTLNHLLSLGVFYMTWAFAINAYALPQIQSQAIALKVIPALSGTWTCLACHYSGAGSASYRSLKPGYGPAYHQDTLQLTRLKEKLNELPNAAIGLSGSGSAKTDSYQVICAANGVSLEFSIRDKAPSKLPIISAQLSHGLKMSPIIKDSVDGDAHFSPITKLVGGLNATYTLTVTKSAYTGGLAEHTGAEIYDANSLAAIRKAH
ncbi:hypothetical protein [Methylocucumis oryzae]|uniref:Uncharacterized protein n=1 Tax=Methylocucumis oryzae TaxID=1632867 RepID=A0A0F3IKZ2_9GAMM|nr:hypothetical protein [Methylocucumis oryzae]KJV07386.1 hypothetical protein VZ94_05090 [Methylocucumis oryzae]